MVLLDIRRRIRSVKNTAQITRAMEVVSATKMRRSQAIAISGRPYALAALDILRNVSKRSPVRPAILTPREVKNTLLVVITSDRGLAGAFNANVLRLVELWIREHDGEAYRIATVGKKSNAFFAARRINIFKTFTGFGDYISQDETKPLAEFVLDGFHDGSWDRVLVFSTNFRTTLKQETKMVEAIPIHTHGIEETIRAITPEYGRFAERISQGENLEFTYEYAFEPSPSAVLERLIPLLFKIQMHHIILESNASEHSARMVAMKNASENAKDLMGELARTYNKARQAGITRELTEITAGREAIEAS